MGSHREASTGEAGPVQEGGAGLQADAGMRVALQLPMRQRCALGQGSSPPHCCSLLGEGREALCCGVQARLAALHRCHLHAVRGGLAKAGEGAEGGGGWRQDGRAVLHAAHARRTGLADGEAVFLPAAGGRGGVGNDGHRRAAEGDGVWADGGGGRTADGLRRGWGWGRIARRAAGGRKWRSGRRAVWLDAPSAAATCPTTGAAPRLTARPGWRSPRVWSARCWSRHAAPQRKPCSACRRRGRRWGMPRPAPPCTSSWGRRPSWACRWGA